MQPTNIVSQEPCMLQPFRSQQPADQPVNVQNRLQLQKLR